MKNLFDTHAHYQDSRYSADREEMLNRMEAEGFSGAIVIGASVSESVSGVEIAKGRDWLYAAVGVHPENCEEGCDTGNLNRLEALAKENPKKVVAIGEIGLDYHYEGYDRDRQISAFKNQMDLAKTTGLPVVIHSRDATEDTLEILEEYRGLEGVLHCYSGSLETAKIVLELGYYISFTGVITFKNANRVREVARSIPLERLLLETDCPYMAPEPFRGGRCDSIMMASTATKLAELKGITSDELVEITTRNAERLFMVNKA